ncbi:hypothetical protein QE152_g11404 [Popillia japonica]|uniref:Uncharacterized protein n=1 Tax=Popillia japonica TaxID=7064 RepID=A0AAW1LRF5_POPJA
MGACLFMGSGSKGRRKGKTPLQALPWRISQEAMQRALAVSASQTMKVEEFEEDAKERDSTFRDVGEGDETLIGKDDTLTENERCSGVAGINIALVKIHHAKGVSTVISRMFTRKHLSMALI